MLLHRGNNMKNLLKKKNKLKSNNLLSDKNLEVEEILFGFEDKVEEKLDVCLINALFKTLFDENKITKKEYDRLIQNVHRTYQVYK